MVSEIDEKIEHSTADFEKLKDTGFLQQDQSWSKSVPIMDGQFQLIMHVDDKGILSWKIVDQQTSEEYVLAKTSRTGDGYSQKVRSAAEQILNQVLDSCFVEVHHHGPQAKSIIEWIEKNYQVKPEYLWKKYPDYCVFRKPDHKWFGIMMNVSVQSLDEHASAAHNHLQKDKEAEVLDLKLDPNQISTLKNQKGFCEAWHMNKKSWISVLLDGTLRDEQIFPLIQESWNLV